MADDFDVRALPLRQGAEAGAPPNAARQDVAASLLDRLRGFAYRCRNDADWSVEFISDGVLQLTGYLPSEFLCGAASLPRLIHPDDREQLDAEMVAAVVMCAPYDLEYRIRTRSGEERWVWERGRPVQGPDGRVSNFEGFVTEVADRQRTREMLREREGVLLRERAFTEAVIDGLPAVFYVFDSHGRFARWNRNYETVTGYSSDEIAGMQPLDFVAPGAARDLVAKHIDEVFGKGAGSVEADCISKAGVVYRYLMTARRFESEGETYVLGFGIDISERRRAEEALRMREAELRLITDRVPAAIAHFGAGEVCQYANARYAQLFGFTGSGTAGRTLREIIGDADAYPEVARHFAKALTGAQVNYTRPLRRPDGGFSVVDVSLVPERAGEGVRGVHVLIRDITEQARAEATLRRSEQLKSAMLASALDAIVTIDADGRIVEFNPAAERCFGYSRAAIRGRPVVDLLIPHRLRDAHLTGLQRYLQTGDAPILGRRIEMPALRADGTEITVEIAIIAIAGSKPQLFTAFMRDISERKRAEEALKLAKERLASALEGSSLALWDIDLASGQTYMSEGWARMLGEEPKETVTTVAELQTRIPADDLEVVRTLLSAVVKGERDVYDADHRVRTHTGELIWIHGRGKVAARDSAGRALRLTGTCSDITERKQADARIEALATRDVLTGLPNRSLFGDRLRQAIAAVQRDGGRLAVMFIDLDRFKAVNDSLGHHAGDLLLREAAARLSGCLRRSDTVARQGGDEFIVLIPGFEAQPEVEHAAQKILAALESPFALDGHEVVIGASIGLAVYPDDATDESGLLRNADLAMYHAKQAGRHNVQFFAEHMNHVAQARLSLEGELRRALRDDQFVLHYQPLIDLTTGATTGYEALIRWRHPSKGLVYPGEFIATAEDAGMIPAIGEWVLQAGCRQLREWQRAGCSQRLALNVSASQFRHKQFAGVVERAIADHAIDAKGALDLEVTESVLMAGESLATLQALASMGIKLVVDDFGTGYSNLAYLKRLPLAKLKIDRTFVRDIPGDSGDVAIVKTIIALTHSLGLRVVAEGVESIEQHRLLQELGCDEGQGYYYGKPAAA